MWDYRMLLEDHPELLTQVEEILYSSVDSFVEAIGHVALHLPLEDWHEWADRYTYPTERAAYCAAAEVMVDESFLDLEHLDDDDEHRSSAVLECAERLKMLRRGMQLYEADHFWDYFEHCTERLQDEVAEHRSGFSADQIAQFNHFLRIYTATAPSPSSHYYSA